MLLRKHIEGGFIEKIEQAGLDRIMIFRIKAEMKSATKPSEHCMLKLWGATAILFSLTEKVPSLTD